MINTFPSSNATLYLDPRPTAELMLHLYGELFKKPEPQGFFLPWTRKPVLVDSTYLIVNRKEEFEQGLAISLADIRSVKTNIYNTDGKLAVRKEDLRHLREERVVPTVQLDLLEAMVDACIVDLSAWVPAANKPDPVDVAKEFIITEHEYYMNPSRQVEYADWATAGVIGVLRMVEHFLKPLIRFIGDDTWIIHERHQSGNDIFVHKTVDYRIQEWTRLKDLGII